MSDPKRWNQEGAGAPDRAMDLLRTAARPRPMTSIERARTAARVTRLGAASGAGTGLATGLKGMLIVVGLGAAGLAARGLVHDGGSAAVSTEATLLRRLPAERLLTVARALASPLEMAPAPPAPEAQAPRIEAPRPAEPAKRKEQRAHAAPLNEPAPPPAPQETAAPEGDALLREAARLEQARAALSRSPEASLAALDKAHAEFPKGQLTAEREFIAIDALLRLGRDGEARARAQSFLDRFPSSPYAERVRRMVGASP